MIIYNLPSRPLLSKRLYLPRDVWSRHDRLPATEAHTHPHSFSPSGPSKGCRDWKFSQALFHQLSKAQKGEHDFEQSASDNQQVEVIASREAWSDEGIVK